MTRLVYTIDPEGGRSPRGGPCRVCGANPCQCPVEASIPPAAHLLRVRRETAGRGGRVATIVSPLNLTRSDACALLTRLKRACGAGGSLGTCATSAGPIAFQLELQGDLVARVSERLVQAGYRIAPSRY